MRRYLFILFLSIGLYAQQINYTWGVKTPSGDDWAGNAITYIDTTTGTTNDFVFDLNDFYWLDAFPVETNATGDFGSGGDSTLAAALYSNSTRFFVGTFYGQFDNQGTGSPTTDSVLFTIKAYPGVYSGASKAISGIKYGTAVTLQTIRVVNDYFSANNVYIHSSLGKSMPPEVIKIEVAPIGTSDADDSTAFSWKFAYPAIYQQQKEHKVY